MHERVPIPGWVNPDLKYGYPPPCTKIHIYISEKVDDHTSTELRKIDSRQHLTQGDSSIRADYRETS